MKRFNKFSKINKKKKVILSVMLMILILGIISAGVFIHIFAKKDKTVNVPDVSLENMDIKVSETEVTCDDVIIEMASKLEGYRVYYYIYPIIEQNEIKIEAAKEDENIKNSTNVINTSIEVKKEIENIMHIKDEEYILYEEKIVIEKNSDLYFKYELNGKYSKNSYKIEINNIEKSEEKSEEATEEELENEKIIAKDTQAKYYIKVNVTANVVTIYGKNAENEYANPIKAMTCSTGKATPSNGVYKISDKYKWRSLFGNVYGQYATRIVGSILFHSVPYTKADNGSLEYWEYDKLGTSASLGCVRLTVADALWIYNNCGKGTQVEFYSSSTPGPLGKPVTHKISNEEFRDWDPTDLISTNPWITGVIPNKTTSGNSTPPVVNNEDSNMVNDNIENTSLNNNTDQSDAIVISECEHKYVINIDKKPTCIEQGIETHTCSICGYKYDVPIAKTDNHEYINDKCIVCKADKPIDNSIEEDTENNNNVGNVEIIENISSNYDLNRY